MIIDTSSMGVSPESAEYHAGIKNGVRAYANLLEFALGKRDDFVCHFPIGFGQPVHDIGERAFAKQIGIDYVDPTSNPREEEFFDLGFGKFILARSVLLIDEGAANVNYCTISNDKLRQIEPPLIRVLTV